MNPLTNMKNVLKLSEQELFGRNKTSWHDQYRDSAWVFVGGLPYDLSEGDVICIFSQYGEIIHVNLIRDKDTGKSRGFGFICYEDQHSTDLAVDNFNGIKILNRTIRVDHVSNYKVPKSERDKVKQMQEQQPDEQDADSKLLVKRIKMEVGREVQPDPVDARETLADQIVGDIKLPFRLPIYPIKREPSEENADDDDKKMKKLKKSKKEKKTKKSKKKKKKRKKDSCSDSSSSNSD